MKKTETQLILSMIAMVAYIAIILFGITYGPKYPMVFFWALMILAVGIFSLLVRPKVKDAIFLCVGLLVLGVVYVISTEVLEHYGPNNWVLKFFIKVCIHASVYFPVWNHFLKTIRNSKLGAEVEEARKVSKK